MAKELNKYSFIGHPSNLLSLISSYLANDPNWSVSRNTYYEGTWARNSDNLFLVSKVNSEELCFTLCMNRWSYDYYLYWGMKNNFSTSPNPFPDVYNARGWTYATPFSTNSGHYNAQYDFTIWTNEDFVYIHGDLRNTQGTAFPVRIWLGRLTPHSVEDPAIAKDFVGIFPMIPIGESNWDYGYTNRRTNGKGIVRKSRNGTEYVDYYFTTMADMTSPGAGDIFHVSPFYVWASGEGVRGEFTGVRTAVLKNPAEYPDDSILDLGTDKYRIFYVTDNPITSNAAYYIHSNNSRAGYPRFFPSQQRYAGGQRVLLFKI